MKSIVQFTIAILLLFNLTDLPAIVKYDEGRIQIDGIQLFEDSENPKYYYYLPQYPRLAQREDGSFEFLFIKYIGTGGPETNGGLFHALLEFSLLPEQLTDLQTKLQKVIPGGQIIGPVPLQENIKDGAAGVASFEIVSSILSEEDTEQALTQNFTASGHAPLLPGSRSAIAAKLSQEGATLLWASLEGATSDVSVAISGFYEAAVKGYNAIIQADASTLYKHFSNVMGSQEGYSISQLRYATDKLVQDQTLKVEVFDRAKGLDIKTGDMQAIVDLVTNKLIELMFDPKAGWAQTPEPIPAVEKNQFPGRQKRGALTRLFSGSGNQPYVTDHQFILKNIRDIRTNKFYLNLSKSTTIKVPFFSTGNIRGFYNQHRENSQYFRIINMEDPSFQKREVLFQVDGAFNQAFGDILNFVNVSFKKTYPNGQPAVLREILIKGNDLLKGTNLKTISYPALGLAGEALASFQYRVSWSFKGNSKTVTIPSHPDQWLQGREVAVSLRPPFDKTLLEIDADRAVFQSAGIKSASIRFFSMLNGRPQVQRTLVLRADDPESTDWVALYFDKDQPTAYQVNWYPEKSQAPIKGPVIELTDTFLHLVPPKN